MLSSKDILTVVSLILCFDKLFFAILKVMLFFCLDAVISINHFFRRFRKTIAEIDDNIDKIQ
jgi:hypothetical protein